MRLVCVQKIDRLGDMARRLIFSVRVSGSSAEADHENTGMHSQRGLQLGYCMKLHTLIKSIHPTPWHH